MKVFHAFLMTVFCLLIFVSSPVKSFADGQIDEALLESFSVEMATDFLTARIANPNLQFDADFVADWLEADISRIEKYKPILLHAKDKNSSVVNFAKIRAALAEAQDTADPKIGYVICENNRSYQVALDVGIWTVAIGTAFFTAGTSLMAAGGWTMANIIRVVSTHGIKKIVSMGIKEGLRKAIAMSITKKLVILAGTGALVYAVNSNGGIAGAISSVLDSSKQEKGGFVNCRDLDSWWQNNCYTVCGKQPRKKGVTLNDKVFRPVLHSDVCISNDSSTPYVLHYMNADYSKGNVVMVNIDQSIEIANAAIKYAQDNNKATGCDWGNDDLDMYIGRFIYDPETLEPDTNYMIINDVIRIDD